jgi:hypothetical protein
MSPWREQDPLPHRLDLFSGLPLCSGKLLDLEYPVSVLLLNRCSDRRHSVIVNGNEREPHTPTLDYGSIVV